MSGNKIDWDKPIKYKGWYSVQRETTHHDSRFTLLSPLAKLVYIFLLDASNMSRNHVGWFTKPYSLLRDETGISIRELGRCKEELVRSGLVEQKKYNRGEKRYLKYRMAKDTE